MADHQKCAFDIIPLHFFDFFETVAIAINSNSHFRANFRYQSHGHELEQKIELELLFLFELCAREAASLGATGHEDSVKFSTLGSPIDFRTLFYQKLCEMEPQMASKMLQNPIKNDT